VPLILLLTLLSLLLSLLLFKRTHSLKFLGMG
jgi:hypothetical protein